MAEINFIDYQIEVDETKTEFIDNSKSVFSNIPVVKYNEIDEKKINYLPLHIRQPFDVSGLIAQIPNEIFLLMQRGLIRPLIIMVTEQWDLFDTMKWSAHKNNLLPDFSNTPYSKMIQHFTSRSVPEENIIWLVPENNHVNQIHFLRQMGYTIKTKFIQFDYFLELMKEQAKKISIGKRNFRKHFSCLCRGTPRNHRFGIIYNLWTANLFDKGNISCEPYVELTEKNDSYLIDDSVTTNTFMKNFDSWMQNAEKFKALLPINFDLNKNLHWTRVDESSLFLDSFLWISSETKKPHDGIYITEKTWKAMAYGSPFLINGDKGSLQHLRNLGYRTFNDFWDESYDTMRDVDKIKKICSIVKKICSKDLEQLNVLYNEMLPILKHNQQMLIKNEQHKNLMENLSYAKD